MTPSATPAPEPTPRAWWRRAFDACVNWLKGTTVRWNVLVGFAFVAAGFYLTAEQMNGLNRTAIREVERSTRQDLFLVELAAYGRSVADYKLCVEAVELSFDNRAQWEITVDRLREIGGAEFAQVLADGPLLAGDPRQLEDCNDPGDPPIPPNH